MANQNPGSMNINQMVQDAQVRKEEYQQAQQPQYEEPPQGYYDQQPPQGYYGDPQQQQQPPQGYQQGYPQQMRQQPMQQPMQPRTGYPATQNYPAPQHQGDPMAAARAKLEQYKYLLDTPMGGVDDLNNGGALVDGWINNAAGGMTIRANQQDVSVPSIMVDIDLDYGRGGYKINRTCRYTVLLNNNQEKAMYERTYDMRSCVSGCSWEDALVKAFAAAKFDPAKDVYMSADVVMTLAEPLVDGNGKEILAAGHPVGMSMARTAGRNWVSLLSDAVRAGLAEYVVDELTKQKITTGRVVRVKITNQTVSSNTNRWGVPVFHLMPPEDQDQVAQPGQ